MCQFFFMQRKVFSLYLKKKKKKIVGVVVSVNSIHTGRLQAALTVSVKDTETRQEKPEVLKLSHLVLVVIIVHLPCALYLRDCDGNVRRVEIRWGKPIRRGLKGHHYEESAWVGERGLANRQYSWCWFGTTFGKGQGISEIQERDQRSAVAPSNDPNIHSRTIPSLSPFALMFYMLS